MAERAIEAAINGVLTGDARANALDFVAHLRAKGVPFGEAEQYWEINYRGENVCFLWIDGADQAPGPWTIWSDQVPGTWVTWAEGGQDGQPADLPLDARTKKIAWANVNHCASCGSDCSPGKRKTILGKAFDGVCGSALAFASPDSEALACAKAMVDARIGDIEAK